MFDVEYKGGNSVVITTKEKQLLIDPNITLYGLKIGKYKNVVQLATDKQFSLSTGEDEVAFEGPGEYEVGPFSIRGVAAKRHTDGDTDEMNSTIYHIDIGEVRIGVIGNVHFELSEDQLESIGVVDILVIPVGGGGYTIDALNAANIVRQVEPRIVIPVHYADPAIPYPVSQEPVELFTKELGAPVEVLSKLKVKALANLPQNLTVYHLERS